MVPTIGDDVVGVGNVAQDGVGEFEAQPAVLPPLVPFASPCRGVPVRP
jgi:hypothetical protein